MRNPRHILITGASSGIGSALAFAYASPGTMLSLHGRDEERLSAVVQTARQLGAEATGESGDVAEALPMEKWVRSVDVRRPIDLVIANAGISAGTAGGFESREQIQRIWDVNVGGVLNTVIPAIPLLVGRTCGQIALMSSLASFRGLPGAPAYCASKAAVRVYGEALRAELAEFGVEVNVVCPGFVETPMTDKNTFPMPFKMSASKAGKIIRSRLEKNEGRIAFPFLTYAGSLCFSSLPEAILDRLARLTPKK